MLAIGALIAAVVMIGSVRTTWSFSAFSVLIYYALTNLAALKMPASERLYPRAVAVTGLAACLGLAFWVDVEIWRAGLVLIALGLGWHAAALRVRTASRPG